MYKSVYLTVDYYCICKEVELSHLSQHLFGPQDYKFEKEINLRV